MSTRTSRNTEQERVGATVREMRQMRGLRPDELATSCGISRSYLSNIEAGRKRLTPILAARIAAALKVPQIALIAFEDDVEVAS